MDAYDFLDITGRFSSKNDPKSSDFQVSTTLGAGVNVELKVFLMTFGAKTTCIKSAICEFTEKRKLPLLEEL